MNDLTIFNNKEFGQIRGLEIDGKAWLVGKDVALALGYTNPQKAVRDHVDGEDKGVNEMDTPGGKQNLMLINESGAYSLILSSKLPSAKRFKHWVTSEVLPSIYKTGSFGNSEYLVNAIDRASDFCSELELKEYDGQCVITLKDIDEAHQLQHGTAGKIFYDNRDNFVFDRDFYQVPFMDLPNEKFGQYSKSKNPSNKLTLITKRGYRILANHLDMDNPLTFLVYKTFFRNYFNRPHTLILEDGNKFMKCAEIMANCKEPNRNYVVNILKHIVSDIGEVKETNPQNTTKYMNATEIGKFFGVSARVMNVVLEEQGLQYKNEYGRWELTDFGKTYGLEVSYHTKNSYGANVRWYPEVIEYLKGEKVLEK